MAYYQVTLNQGRTDTITIEANSVSDIKKFFNAISTANITMIKKIVYSKDKKIGSSIPVYELHNFNYKKLLALVSNGEITSQISLEFPKKDIKKDKVVNSIKKNLLLNNKKITKIYDVVIVKD